MKKTFFLILMLFGYLNAMEIINGTTEIIEVNITKAGVLTRDGKTVPWISHPKDKTMQFALIPASYYAKGEIVLFHKGDNFENTIKFKIKQGNYAKESLQVDSQKVFPPKKVSERIKNESKEANKIYNSLTKKIYWNNEFLKPMNSKITSPFGVARVFNGELKSYHSGVDFRAPIGSSIKATNDGIVVIAKDRYYSGGSVVLDHGFGVYSSYFHLSTIGVKVGDKVKKSQVLGLSGNTGRVTGPHLHFGFMVQGVQVDPLDFIEKMNSLMI